MTHRTSRERQPSDDELTSWMHQEAPARAPDRILERARSDFGATSQDPASGPRLAAIASLAAVAAAAALTLSVIQFSPRTGDPTGTTVPGASATASQVVVGTPSGSASTVPSPSAGTSTFTSIDGSYTFAALDAGSVTIAVAGRAVSLVEVDAGQEWSTTPDDAEQDEVEFDFTRGTHTVEFAAEIEDGRVLEVSIEERSELVDGTRLIQLPDGAGTIELRITGTQIATAPVVPASGWDVDDERRDPEDGDLLVTLGREDGLARVVFEVDVEDGGFLDLEITLYRSGAAAPT